MPIDNDVSNKNILINAIESLHSSSDNGSRAASSLDVPSQKSKHSDDSLSRDMPPSGNLNHQYLNQSVNEDDVGAVLDQSETDDAGRKIEITKVLLQNKTPTVEQS